MRLMHTKLPDFYQKVTDAAKKRNADTKLEIRGMENFRAAKLASLRVGRVEDEIMEITEDPNVEKVEVIIMPRVPETDHSVIIKGIYKDGTCKKAILESMLVTSAGEDIELEGVEIIDDRRYKLP
ncbi:hypothetical protein LJC42_04565 [Eubacteriales bacterium OttesenSCG-928-K08]|nr:hypothetical protein [Eubacteriales bacterium OttesenSCG-928-K08]